MLVKVRIVRGSKNRNKWASSVFYAAMGIEVTEVSEQCILWGDAWVLKSQKWANSSQVTEPTTPALTQQHLCTQKMQRGNAVFNIDENAEPS